MATALQSCRVPGEAVMSAFGWVKGSLRRLHRRRRISPGPANCCRPARRADGARSHANHKVQSTLSDKERKKTPTCPSLIKQAKRDKTRTRSPVYQPQIHSPQQLALAHIGFCPKRVGEMSFGGAIAISSHPVIFVSV